MNPDLLHILQHSLGCDQHGQPPQGYRPNSDDEFGCYRNRYVTHAESPAGDQCQQLVAQGFMKDHGAVTTFGGMHCYSVTQAGYDAMKAHSPAPPKLSRSKQRYQDYLKVADCFKNFLHYLRHLQSQRPA